MSQDDVGVILQRLDEHGRVLDEIRRQVRETNGRVRKLELWRATVEGMLAGATKSLGWMPQIATGVIIGVLVGVAHKFL